MLGNINLANISPFSPLKLPGLKGWWDFSDSSTITKDGADRVSAVNDKSGNGKTILQAIGADQPLWVSGVQNGLDVLRFNSSNTEFMASPAAVQVNDHHDLFVVAKTDLIGSFRDLIGNGTTSVGTSAILLMCSTNINTSRAHYWGNGALTTVDSNATNSTNWKQYNQGLSDTNLFIRISAAADNTVLRLGTYPNTSQPIYVGWRGSSTAWFDGDMGEVIIFDEYLSADNRALIENYLTVKWGL